MVRRARRWRLFDGLSLASVFISYFDHPFLRVGWAWLPVDVAVTGAKICLKMDHDQQGLLPLERGVFCLVTPSPRSVGGGERPARR